MFKYIYELIQMHRELHGAIKVMRSKRKDECRSSMLPPYETHLLGLQKGSYIWSLLAEYKIFTEEKQTIQTEPDSYIRNINTDGFKIGDNIYIDGVDNEGVFTITKSTGDENLKFKIFGVITSKNEMKIIESI